MTDPTELVERLRDQQDMIQLGEDAYEAADAIERLTRDLQSAALDAIAAHGQAADNYTRAVEAEARIAELTRERDDARAAALEEAAKVALGEMYGFAPDQLTEHGVGYERACKDIAAAIRALKEPVASLRNAGLAKPHCPNLEGGKHD
jgi:hypothetical protein